MHVDKVRSLTNFHSNHDCTVNKRLKLEAPVLHTYACWQDIIAFQFSSKWSTSLTSSLKFKDWNRIHWQVHNALEPSGLYVYAWPRRIRSGWTILIATMSRDVRIPGELRFVKICLEVLAYSLIFKRNAFSPIAFIGVCECVRVCVRACVRACVCVTH